MSWRPLFFHALPGSITSNHEVMRANACGRELEKQIDAARKRNARAEGVVAGAQQAESRGAGATGSGQAHAAHLLNRADSIGSTRSRGQ